MTVVYLTEKLLKKNFKAFGFKSYEAESISHFNKIFQNFVENQLKKGISKHHGGRIVLPMEYFGVETNHFVAHPEFTSMAVTDTHIRPPMEMQVLDSQAGGARKFSVSLKAVESAIEEISAKHTKEVYRKQRTAKAIQQRFEKIAAEILHKVSKKSENKEHLQANHLQTITNMKKYSYLH
jgi:hypothetical protein